jgi:hypothetical protein
MQVSSPDPIQVHADLQNMRYCEAESAYKMLVVTILIRPTKCMALLSHVHVQRISKIGAAEDVSPPSWRLGSFLLGQQGSHEGPAGLGQDFWGQGHLLAQ